jgi:hypothetical protein
MAELLPAMDVRDVHLYGRTFQPGFPEKVPESVSAASRRFREWFPSSLISVYSTTEMALSDFHAQRYIIHAALVQAIAEGDKAKVSALAQRHNEA